MADHVDITLWIDRRWKEAIEKHLRDETLEEHLENVLDELCNQLPEREYERISRAIQSEAAAQRAEEEAVRTYAAYHVTEHGQEWYFKTSPGEELLVACKKLRSYVTAEKGTAPDKFIGMFFGRQPITAKAAPSNPYELIEEITEQCLHRQCSVIFIICLIFGDAVDVSSSRLGKEVAQCDSQRNADTLNRGNA